MNRIIVAAGGTGGHFYPGLVLAQTLRRRGWQTLLLVRREDPAVATLEREGLAYAEVELRGLPRRLSPQAAAYPWRLAKAVALCGRIVRDFTPKVVVGMGGYLSFPAMAAAAWRGVPRVVHESNALLGLSNRMAIRLGAKLLIGLPGTRPGAFLTGTPIRPPLWERRSPGAARERLGLDPRTPTLLVFGGSQGARVLNERFPALMAATAKSWPPLQILHLAGRGQEGAVAGRYGGVPVRALPYLEEMEYAYAAADLVICRAGASTLAELSAQKAPAVLVPYPHAADDHQTANARLVERAGSARLIPESFLEQRLTDVVFELLFANGAHAARLAMTAGYESLGLPPAGEVAERIAAEVERLAH